MEGEEGDAKCFSGKGEGNALVSLQTTTKSLLHWQGLGMRLPYMVMMEHERLVRLWV